MSAPRQRRPLRQLIDDRVEIVIGIVAVALLVVGCFMVLQPFLSALLWGAILAYSTWPIYQTVKRRLGGRSTLAASLMTLLLAMAFVLPIVVVGSSAVDGVNRLLDIFRTIFANGIPPAPIWLNGVPIIGPPIVEAWQEISLNASELWTLLQPYFSTIRDFLIALAVSVGGGLIEISLAVFAAFFFYRDGELVVGQARAIGTRIAGERISSLMETVGDTMKSVVFGVVGTALIQGALCGIGFWITGIPSAFVLGFICFVTALLPLGPAVIWLPIDVWLFMRGEIGWGIFLLIWGVLIVGGLDNVIRPWLISRGGSLGFLPGFLGVVGGAFAFGFLGIFLGPVLLAVGIAVVGGWVDPESPADSA
ncbi:Predicted PurR-regulated permease PerM [Arboricoccus pini]|uniref:Predicted PurR-regulated permease PerM n=1 Tax=Arboricoccus pini TaxID=1963835 RepID=A0A212R0S4_9PROT|nr:AI-2E family transporter [Arboricoccus pini]SNB65440.1 Predicted PurR-regulated permease PerM [Arboricoccus pini]